MATIIPTDEFYDQFSSTVEVGVNFFKRFNKLLLEKYHIDYLRNHTLYHSVFYRLVLKIRERYPIVSDRSPYRMDDTILTQIKNLPSRDTRLVEKMNFIVNEIQEFNNEKFKRLYHFDKIDLYHVIHSFIDNLYWFKMFDFDVKNDKTKVFSVLTKLTYRCDKFLHLCGGKQNKDSSLFKFILYMDSAIKLECRIKKTPILRRLPTRVKKDDSSERLLIAQNLLALSRV